MAHRIVGGTAASKDRRRNIESSAHAKDIILAGIRSGMTIRRACEAAGRVESTYGYYRTSDPNFRTLADAALQARAEGYKPGQVPVPDFPEFCETYLGTKLFWHHMQWVDLLEGREPRDLHPNQRYVPGEPDQILVNTPPEHSKSVTLTINYVTWRIVQDPNIRILIISKTQDMAKKFLVAIKDRLSENEAYARLQQDFGPPGGFAEGAARWAADAIYVAGRDSGEKDPTVQAQGIKGQIYGSRCDLAIMDDCVDHTNHHDFESQIDWIQNQVGSRVADAGGRMLLIGTRMNTQDLYSEILKPAYYVEGESPWTYLTQPAVLEYADDPKDWKTLWPATNRHPVSISGRKAAEAAGWPRDGLWPMWHGEALSRKRRKMRARNWSMVYMQEQVAEDSVFKQEDVQGCVDRARYPGRLMPGQSGHRRYGMEGTTVIAGLDPAAAGYTAIQVWALDRQTGVRWVLEIVNRRQMPPHDMRAEIKRITERYGVGEWRIEKNAYQQSIVQDALIRDMLHSRGCLISPHHTNCVPGDVQILTRRGWLHHSEVTVGEDVLTHLGWQPLQAVNVGPAPEKMYRVETSAIDCDFTAGHRHAVRWLGNSSREDRFVTTEQLRSNTPLRTTVNPVEGRGIGGVHLAAILGWYVCEGQDKGAAVNIAQSPVANPSKWQEIKGHLDALGWRYSIYHQETADRFHVWAEDAVVLRSLAPGKGKALGVGTIVEMTVDEREAFMDACLKGDGHGNEFANSDAHLIEAFEMAAILNGCSIRRTRSEHPTQFRRTKPFWRVRRKVRKLAHVKHAQHDQVRVVEGVGEVWCPTTAAGSWVALSRGTSFLTGNSNKWDSDFGVASMATLFEGWREGRNLIRLPSQTQSEPVRNFVEQLVSWSPETKGLTDTVMAAWFVEIRCRELMMDGHDGWHSTDSEFLSPRDREGQMVVDLEMALAAGEITAWDGTLRGFPGMN